MLVGPTLVGAFCAVELCLCFVHYKPTQILKVVSNDYLMKLLSQLEQKQIALLTIMTLLPEGFY